MASLDELALGAGALPAPDYINTLDRIARARRQQYAGPAAPTSLSDLAAPAPAPARPTQPWLDPMSGAPANEESLRTIGRGVYGALNMPAELARSALQSSGSLQYGGSYDPRPAFDAAMLTMGGTSFGAPYGALGAGPVRRAPAKTITELRAELTPAEKAAPYAEAKFPQYAEEYPPTGPPGIDEATGRPTRQLTEEAIAFQKERNRIQRDMDKRGFTPYYDPAKRFDVEPGKYPAPQDTSTVMPKKEKTINDWMARIGAEESRARLNAAVARGEDLGNAQDWYLMGQMERDFTRALGPKAGREAFANRFAAPVAATTTGQSPTGNVMLANYANFQRELGRPMPQAFYEAPYPIQRGKYGIVPNLAQYEKIMEAGGLRGIGLENPKRHDFAYDFLGHKFPVMDEQMVGGMTGLGAPQDKYGLYRKVVEQEAAKAGRDPRYYQEVGWAGFKDEKGKPMISHVNEIIERTHRLTGMPRKEIMERGFMGMGRPIPLYGVAGAAAVPSLYDLTQNNQ